MDESDFLPNPNPHVLEAATRPPSTTQMWLIEMSPMCGTHPEIWDKNLTMDIGVCWNTLNWKRRRGTLLETETRSRVHPPASNVCIILCHYIL